MVGEKAATVAEVAALREQLRAAQQGVQAPYRAALAWVARRAEAHAVGAGLGADDLACAALRLVHGLRHTYDPARSPVVWVDALIEHAARRLAAAQPAMANPRAAVGAPVPRLGAGRGR